MPNHFHNPYLFTPVSGKNGPGAVDVKKFPTELPAHLTHDRYVTSSEVDEKKEPVYSGSLYARLQAETPFFIGGKQNKNLSTATSVEAFKHGEKLAVPATSLAGMLTSLAEAASNSALRILDGHKQMSFRKEMNEGLSALGMIRIDDNGSCYLLPLAMPHLKADQFESPMLLNKAVPSGGRYSRMFPKPRPKAYFGDDRIAISNHEFLNAQMDRIKTNDGFGTLALAANPFDLEWQSPPDDHSIKGFRMWPEWSRVKNVGQAFFMLGIKTQADGFKCPGIFRALGVTHDRQDQIPTGKRHELFIPCSQNEIAEFLAGRAKEFPVKPFALERFRILADERTKSEDSTKGDMRLPYEPIGTRGEDRGAGDKLRLKTGDIVYFRPDETGENVVEISFSSIWRGRVETLLDEKVHTVADFFEGVNANLLPLGASSAKSLLTIAELLFGFVEQSKEQSSRALAGRVRFHAALPNEEDLNTKREPRQDDEVLLKVLSSPKLPSPPFYFENRKNPTRFPIAKDLKPEDFQPKGRKIYLHHNDQHPNSEKSPDWKSLSNERDHLKLKIRPLRRGSTFYFRLDFDNLSRTELGLLCYALRPTEHFHHKLGLGKPIGLGTVRIDPVALRFIDRVRRYREDDPFSPFRFHFGWDNVDLNEIPEGWIPALPEDAPPPDFSKPCDFKSLLEHFTKRSADLDSIRKAIETLGDPAKVEHPVHYPQREGRTGADLEKDGFKWFVDNTKKQGPWIPGRHTLDLVEQNSRETRLPRLPRRPQP